jgi:uncharacterized protein with HEPN domain
MAPETPKLLADMLDAAKAIQQLCADLDADRFVASRTTRDATHWNFTVLGEAMGALARVDPETAAQVSEYRRIIAYRNRLVHGYGVIDPRITWDVIVSKLPRLLDDLQSLMPR